MHFKIYLLALLFFESSIAFCQGSLYTEISVYNLKGTEFSIEAFTNNSKVGIVTYFILENGKIKDFKRNSAVPKEEQLLTLATKGKVPNKAVKLIIRFNWYDLLKEVCIKNIIIKIDSKRTNIKNWSTGNNYYIKTVNLETCLFPNDLSNYGNNNNGKTFIINKTPIYIEQYGEGEPILLLHGNNGSISSLSNQIEYLKKYYRVIAVDSRFHGRSTFIPKANVNLTYQLMADDMVELLDSLKIGKCSVFGWSDGGIVGLLMALKKQERLNKLVIFGANLFPGKRAIKKSDWNDYKKQLLTISILRFLNPLKWRKSHIIGRLPNKYPQIDPNDLKRITIPVLVLAGEFDLVKEAHSQLISNSIPNSEIHILSGESHYAPIENPTIVNLLIHQFLNKNNY